MVKYQPDALGRTFQALADPTRRAILARLEDESGLSVSALAEPFPMQLNAVMKHLDVLSKAGLVRGRRRGREHVWELDPRRIEAAHGYLDDIARQWDDALDRLRAFVERP